MSSIQFGDPQPARDAEGGILLDCAAVRRAREAAELIQAEVSARMLRLGWRLNQPQVSMAEHGECRLSEDATMALAAVLSVGPRAMLPARRQP